MVSTESVNSYNSSLIPDINSINPKAQESSLILASTLSGADAVRGENPDSVNLAFDDSLILLAQKVSGKLQDLLKKNFPDGVPEYKPNEVTPEATAERIVTGVASLFSSYQRANPELEGEELIKGFMEQARKGVESGYSDAFDTLKGLGAFDLPGIQEGIEQTKELLGTKLDKLEETLRDQLGVGKDISGNVARSVTTETLVQAQQRSVNIAA